MVSPASKRSDNFGSMLRLSSKPRGYSQGTPRPLSPPPRRPLPRSLRHLRTSRARFSQLDRAQDGSRPGSKVFGAKFIAHTGTDIGIYFI